MDPYRRGRRSEAVARAIGLGGFAVGVLVLMTALAVGAAPFVGVGVIAVIGFACLVVWLALVRPD